MKNIKEFYILGEPIKTEVGDCDFILVKEYPDYVFELQTMSLNKDGIINEYHSINKDGVFDGLINEMKKSSLFTIVQGIPELRETYQNVFLKVFKDEDAMLKINEDNFEYYRKLILEMNCIKEEKINPNPEIQRAIERSKRVKQSEGGKLEFSDVVSSVVGFNGLSYKDVKDMTIYQLYMTFHRIAQIKGYDTSTLFATVSTEKINIESWCKHIDLYEEEKHGLSRDDFESKANGIFKDGK